MVGASAFIETNPTDEPITSVLPVMRPESGARNVQFPHTYWRTTGWIANKYIGWRKEASRALSRGTIWSCRKLD